MDEFGRVEVTVWARGWGERDSNDPAETLETGANFGYMFDPPRVDGFDVPGSPWRFSAYVYPHASTDVQSDLGGLGVPSNLLLTVVLDEVDVADAGLSLPWLERCYMSVDGYDIPGVTSDNVTRSTFSPFRPVEYYRGVRFAGDMERGRYVLHVAARR